MKNHVLIRGPFKTVFLYLFNMFNMYVFTLAIPDYTGYKYPTFCGDKVYTFINFTLEWLPIKCLDSEML